jgi:hypothetical protein
MAPKGTVSNRNGYGCIQCGKVLKANPIPEAKRDILEADGTSPI